jgi:uncharacterized protein
VTATIKAVLSCNLGCNGCYESEIFRENNNQPEPYDLDAIIKTTLAKTDGHIGLHGGEALLMPVADLERMMQTAQNSGRSIGVQTNLSLLNDRHIELFKEYRMGVGVSLNGPADLNRDRSVVPHSRSLPVLDDLAARTDEMTERIHRNIERLVEAKVPVSIICVLSKTNAGDPGKLKRLIAWANDLGERLGIWSIRFNPLHDDYGGGDIELSEQSAAAVYLRLCKETLGDPRRMWLPFREYVDNLWGLGCQPCWHGGCDVYQTAAVHAVLGDGSEGNCLRTAKDGVAYLRDTQTIDMRGQVLKQTPYEDGGCKNCRHWRVCKGGCPSEGLDGDWRNRSRFCEMYFGTYEYLVQLHKAILPNFTPVQEWTTNSEEELLASISNRKPLVSPINPMLKEWSQMPSSWRQDARTQK